ncbi:MAG: pyridoxal-dependent decarboxylase [Calditrichia bacterium]
MEHQKKFEGHTGDMPPEEFRKYGHQLVDWIAAHFENIDEVPVLPDVSPGDIRNRLPESAPEQPEEMDQILKDIDSIIMPGMTHWNHPDFFAYFSITGSGPGILGELLSAAFNVNGMLWKTSPSLTELEETVLGWLREMLGLPADFWGIVYDTASVSSLHAIAAAREQLTQFQFRVKGMAGRSDTPRLRLYASEHAHSSIDKAAITLGIGMEGIRKIGVDAQFRMNVDELKTAVYEDREKGWQPFCVVATVGTTSTTSIDPVPEIAEVCRQENLWLHVDAAYGGSAAVLPEMQHILDGCNLADSLVVNPHKWMFVPIDFSAFYTRKPRILKQAFSLVAEYLRTPEDEEVENLMDYGIQLGRRFRALKFWFVLRYFGKKGIIERIRYHIYLAGQFISLIKTHPDFEQMAPAPFSTICFRAHPESLSPDKDLNRLNEELLQRVNASRQVFLSHTRLNGQFVLRLAIGNLQTREKHLLQAWEILQQELQNLLQNHKEFK